MLWDIELDNATKVEPENYLQWFIDLIKRILADVFGFIAEEEGWTEGE